MPVSTAIGQNVFSLRNTAGPNGSEPWAEV